MDAETLDRVALAERPRLVGIAYRLTGSRSDAEDLAQEALLRAHTATAAAIESPVAYLTTIVTRLAIDHLRSARVRRESYVGPWLPEPIVADPAPDAAAGAIRKDTLSMAFLVLLEQLSPAERAVLILHDVFAYSHADIGVMIERSEVSCRQLLRRARQRLGAERPRTEVDPTERDEITKRFVTACETGNLESFLALLTTDAELVLDGGVEVRKAARNPIRGDGRVARFLAFVMGRLNDQRRIVPANLNGGPAVLVYNGASELIGALFIQPASSGRADQIYWIRNPTKLAGLTTTR